MSVRLMVVDDHEIVRIGLRALCESHDVQIVAEASTGDEAVAIVESVRPDVVLMEVRMSGGDGLTALGRIKTELPSIAVLMFSAYDNPTYVARAVALGANGYLHKSSRAADIVKAIQEVATGETLWTRDELRRVSGALATPRVSTDFEVPLTQRENEVLRQLSLGLTNREIALALGISYETVKEHVQHILRKLGVSDRTQAAVLAVRKGLV